MNVQSSDQAPDDHPIDWDSLHAGYVRGDDARAAELFEYITKSFLPRILAHIDPGLTEDQRRELGARINYKLHAGGKLRQYRGPDKFLGWLRRLAINERADFFREMRRGFPVLGGSKDDDSLPPLDVDYGFLPPSSRNTPDESADQAEIRQMVAACLGRLSKEDRDLLERRLLDGEDYTQIAAGTGLTPQKAHMKVFRARGKLAECLEKSGMAVNSRKNKVKDSMGKGVKE